MNAELAALVDLHGETPRQGPGDPATLDRMLERLGVAPGARMADLGCGTGATALRLAETLGAEVLAVDAAAPFIDALRRRLAEAPPSRGAVTAVCCDMTAPPVAAGALDAIVSEGAAYAAGFETALRAWRDLVRPGGGLVVSECVWFGAERPPEAAAFWARDYPQMGSVAEAAARAERAGWRVVAAERLSREAWMAGYYAPLAARMAALSPGAGPTLARVIAATQTEMALYSATGAHWGYVYLALDAA